MTTSTGIEKKKELLSSEERRGDARKNTMREKSFKTKQLQKHSYENRAQTTEKKGVATKKEKKPKHHTANELGSGGVKSSHLEGRMRGNEDDDIEPCAIGSRAPPAYQKTHQKRQSKGETR